MREGGGHPARRDCKIEFEDRVSAIASCLYCTTSKQSSGWAFRRPGEKAFAVKTP